MALARGAARRSIPELLLVSWFKSKRVAITKVELEATSGLVYDTIRAIGPSNQEVLLYRRNLTQADALHVKRQPNIEPTAVT